jgi:hypothetical protein
MGIVCTLFLWGRTGRRTTPRLHLVRGPRPRTKACAANRATVTSVPCLRWSRTPLGQESERLLSLLANDHDSCSRVAANTNVRSE